MSRQLIVSGQAGERTSRRHRRPWAAACLVLIGWVVAAPAQGGDEADELLRRGDELARTGQPARALLEWKSGYVQRLPQLRDLPFRYPVVAALLPRAELRGRLVAEIDKEYPEERIDAETYALSRFGFFDPSLDLRSTFLAVLGQEVAGYYDPDTKQLYLVVPDPAPPRKKRWWEKIVGSPADTSGEEQKMVLSHEMAHALVDQHFDLFSLQRSFQDDDDAVLALTALIEGDATLSMFLDALGDEAKAMLQNPDFLAGYLKMVLPMATSFAGGAAFREAPLVVRETLIFPYIQGLLYCLELVRGGSWEPVNLALRQPPLSTEQILHPEKYPRPGSPGDVPMALAFPESCPLPESEWTLVRQNVLGELQVEILLRDSLGSSRSGPAAAGWDGDLYRVYRHSSRPETSCLVWASTWDGPEDAEEFAGAVRECFGKSPEGHGLGEARVEVSGQDVLVVRGHVEDAVAEALIRWAAAVRKSPKEIPVRPFETTVRFIDGALEQTF